MRRRYGDCVRQDGNCTLCNRVNHGRDCHDRKINHFAWARMAAGLDQPTLAKAAGVNISQIQKLERGEIKIENLTAKNLFALADALGCDPKGLVYGVTEPSNSEVEAP